MKFPAAAWLLLLITPALAEPPAEFAFGIPIQAAGQEALLQIEVPQPVYEGVVHADLGDLRVFNAAGEVVPHAFLPKAAPSREKRPPIGLPLFGLRGDAAAGVEGLDVRIDRTSGKTVVTVNAREGQAGAELVGYLVDASSLDQAMHALSLELPPGAGDVMARIRVEASDDLAHWTTLVADAPVVRLEAGGQRLEQLRIEFPARKAKYLRLSWRGRTGPLELTGLTAEPGEVVVDAPRAWKQVTGTAVHDRPGEYAFDLGGHFPVDRLRLALPQPNTVASVEILSRPRSSDPWRRVATTVAYRLAVNGQEVSSPDVPIFSYPDRHWLVRVDQRGGGLGAGALILGAGWVPQRLVFAARGPAPFQLVYGHRDAKPAAYPIETLVPGYRSEGDVKATGTVSIGRATTAAPRTLAGAGATRERIDWKRWALWGSLVLGVAVLGWMALRLARQMAKAERKDEG